MIVLGIESTAHTFGVGVIRIQGDDFSILANQRRLYKTESEGLIPAKLSEHHLSVWKSVLYDALEQASVSISDVELISYSRGPGIGHALRIGFGVAKVLAAKYNIPIVGVNHCVAHLEIGRLFSKQQDPVLLYASGANTQIIAREKGSYRIFGETNDLGVGNFLDTVARMLGLGFPGGPKIESLAQDYDGDLIKLPYSVKGMDVSFSGMQTKVKQIIDSVDKQALCYSIQEHAFAMLVEVTERALAHTQKSSLVLGGGVACNKRLNQMCELMCKDRDCVFYCPPKEVLVDNGVMIAALGYRVFVNKGAFKLEDCFIASRERADQAHLEC